jgi:hypothetical protein
MRALLVSLGLLTALSAAAEEPAGRVRPRLWEVPRAIQAIDVPGRTEALGMPVSIHAVRSQEKVEALEQHFRRQFQEAGLYLPPPQHLVPITRDVQVTGLDPDTYIAYTVFLQPNPDGTTTVILTEAFLAERRREQGSGFAPMMPGARSPLRSRTEGTEVLQYAVKASLEEVHQFHARALVTQGGYREVEPGVFQRGADVLRVSTQPLDNGEVSVVLLKRQDVKGALTPAETAGKLEMGAGRAGK